MNTKRSASQNALTRRSFIQVGAMTGGLLLTSRWGNAFAANNNDYLAKFVGPLRDVTAGHIPIAAKDAGWSGVDHYTLSVSQYTDQLHQDQDPTRLWGYGQGTKKHLGGIIVANRNTPVQITLRNVLPDKHVIPVDKTIDGAELGDNRVSLHLHGGLVPWVSDGGPHAWWDPHGMKGASFAHNFMQQLKARGPGRPRLADNEGEFYYPNHQGARLAWYHDHAMGTTRLNAYAGIASAYVITDDYEAFLSRAPFNLPGPLDSRTKYLVFQDKKFVSDRFLGANPGWTEAGGSQSAGDLGYEVAYPDVGAFPVPSVVPEFFGDTILVNGTVAPYLEVEPRQYRFRMLNACNARFLNPRLFFSSGDPTRAATDKPGPFFLQIGTEAGFIPFPTVVGTGSKELLIAPGERADLIVDLRNVAPGARLILFSNADAPYGGPDTADPSNAYDGSVMPGFTPDSQNILQLRVKPLRGGTDAPIRLPPILTPLDPPLVVQFPGRTTPIPQRVFAGGQQLPVSVKRKTLNEGLDRYGRLVQRLGTDEFPGPGAAAPGSDFGRDYDSAPTEVVAAGSVEVWEILNLTGDTHPMHFHLVNVQVLSRQAFDVDNYVGGAPSYTAAPAAPATNELGWKETVRCPPGQVTRVIMRFELPHVPFHVPPSARTGGNEYVWHCHILEHEEHDMMRPLVVTG